MVTRPSSLMVTIVWRWPPAISLVYITYLVYLAIQVYSIRIRTFVTPPSYLQLARQLCDRIRVGEYGPGAQLPSITQLTGETGLAVGTVRHAIAVLVEEAWAYVVPGRGTYAAEKPPDEG
jgi:GntR family transcriptional regulator